ncbi:MAG: hypothetical protein NT069_04040 [Planctomycetota bacterium]|nr:hypothetical protein [Planctomycetota bacterium]
MMTIAGKALGRRRPLFADWSIPLPPDLGGDGGPTLRQLIEAVVRGEVAAFQQRQHDRQMWRALTTREIDAGAEKGKVAPGPSEVPIQPVDDDQAVGTALEAFEDGLYLVVIDGEEHKSLDQQVFLQPDSRVTFIRLTLLAGG